MKLKNIKVGTKVVPKKAYKAQYNKPDVSTIELYSHFITLDNDATSYTPDYFCENYKLYKGKCVMLNTKASPKANRYVPNRFNNLKWIQNPVTNHKVEQLLRAVLHPSMIFYAGNPVLHVQAECAQVLTELKDLDTLWIGTADEYGYRLAPETNSWLIRNGIKPNAFLLALNQVQIEGIPAMLERDGKLYTLFCALYGVAYEAVFQAQEMNKQYTQYIKRYGVPKHFYVQGVYNDPSKLYEVV